MRTLKSLPFGFAVLALAACFWLAAGGGEAAAASPKEDVETVDTVRLPTLRRPIARDAVITEEDILWVDTNARRLPRTALLDASAIVGMAAKRYLPAGRAILARDVSEPLAVRKGDLVAIVYTTPHMTLTARGRALEDAAAGEAVRTLNAHSNRTVEATAVAPGIVATRQFSHSELAEALR